jgi:hypothetical protein
VAACWLFNTSSTNNTRLLIGKAALPRRNLKPKTNEATQFNTAGVFIQTRINGWDNRKEHIHWMDFYCCFRFGIAQVTLLECSFPNQHSRPQVCNAVSQNLAKTNPLQPFQPFYQIRIHTFCSFTRPFQKT